MIGIHCIVLSEKCILVQQLYSNMCVQSVREVTEDVIANLLLLSGAGSSLENAESVNMLMLINVSML